MSLVYHANKIDMIELLHSLKEPVVRKGKKYKWTKHNSIEFTDNMWYQHSMKRGGLPINFLETFYGMTKENALQHIKNNFDLTQYKNYEKSKKLRIPKKANTNKDAIFYLEQFRNIDKDIIKNFICNGLIYQEQKYKNILFLGKDKYGGIKHIHRRSTHNSNMDIINNLKGSHASYSFNRITESSDLYVFESPIDMLSYISLNKEDWGSKSYLALCGLQYKPLRRILKENENIETVHLCLDNDYPGIETTHNFMEKLKHFDVYVKIDLPKFKDYNEDLRFSKGLSAEAGFNEPAFNLYKETILKPINTCNELRSITLKDITREYSKFICTYKEYELNQTITYDALLITASISLKFARQQSTHIGLNLDEIEIHKRLNEVNDVYGYVNISQNIRNMNNLIHKVNTLFNRKEFHTKKDKVNIINNLMRLTNTLVYTHVFLTLNERNK